MRSHQCSTCSGANSQQISAVINFPTVIKLNKCVVLTTAASCPPPSLLPLPPSSPALSPLVSFIIQSRWQTHAAAGLIKGTITVPVIPVGLGSVLSPHLWARHQRRELCLHNGTALFWKVWNSHSVDGEKGAYGFLLPGLLINLAPPHTHPLPLPPSLTHTQRETQKLPPGE